MTFVIKNLTKCITKNHNFKKLISINTLKKIITDNNWHINDYIIAESSMIIYRFKNNKWIKNSIFNNSSSDIESEDYFGSYESSNNSDSDQSSNSDSEYNEFAPDYYITLEDDDYTSEEDIEKFIVNSDSNSESYYITSESEYDSNSDSDYIPSEFRYSDSEYSMDSESDFSEDIESIKHKIILHINIKISKKHHK